MLSGSQRYYYSRNQQYSITALTDSSGNIVERYRYDAYGNTVILSPTGEVRDQSSVGNVFMYTGRYNHPEIGLMYFRARYYDPQTGEFISRDPLGYVDGMSQYRAYFVPDGLDPMGLRTWYWSDESTTEYSIKYNPAMTKNIWCSNWLC